MKREPLVISMQRYLRLSICAMEKELKCIDSNKNLSEAYQNILRAKDVLDQRERV